MSKDKAWTCILTYKKVVTVYAETETAAKNYINKEYKPYDMSIEEDKTTQTGKE